MQSKCPSCDFPLTHLTESSRKNVRFDVMKCVGCGLIVNVVKLDEFNVTHDE